MEWVSVYDQLPETGVSVIGIDMESGQMEFGFRSEVDIEPEQWVDFGFPLTHWAYSEPPTVLGPHQERSARVIGETDTYRVFISAVDQISLYDMEDSETVVLYAAEVPDVIELLNKAYQKLRRAGHVR